MEEKIILTVVLTKGEDEAYERTRITLEEQSIGKECIQVIYVADTVELRHAITDARGEFISILEPGAELSENAYENAVKVMENKDICVFPIESNERSGHVSAMNSFLKKEKEFQNLEISYQFIHSCYYAFVLKKCAVRPEYLKSQNEILSIWSLLFYVLANTSGLPVVEDALCTVQSTRNFSELWKNLNDREFSQQVIDEFLIPLYRYVGETPDACSKHARYVLMYYFNIFERNFSSEDISWYGYVRDRITGMMENVGSPELYINHLSFSRSCKNYFLKRYEKLEFEDDIIKEKYELISNSQIAPTAIQFVHLNEENVIIWGSTKLYGDESFQVEIDANGERYECQILQKEVREDWFDVTIGYIRYFKAEIPLRQGEIHKLQVVCRANEEDIMKKVYSFGKYAPLHERINLSYKRNNWIFTYCKDKDNTGYMRIEPQTAWKSFRLGIKTGISLLKGGKSGLKAIPVRMLYHLIKKRGRKIWLVSDRVDRGDDNGEVFFEYLREHKPEDTEVYFVLEKNSSDYERVSKLGTVIEPFSWKHKLYHLLSEYVISSQGNFAVVNPFGRYSRNYKDIMSDGKFVFLQHGVTKDDQSAWLNLYNRNICGLIVTTKPEYDSIFTYDYFYTPDRVWLTGMPRYDRLYHDERKYITIMPTWRKALAPSRDGRGVWMVTEDFKESEYFLFYNGLLNHRRLLQTAGRLGYRICFMPHPNTFSVLGQFDQNPDVEFFDLNKSYRKIFAETDLMVTDYSSVAFDFAYLRKPLLYSQFDHDEFFSGSHSYTKGYFDYERDGFGEVEYTLEGTVDRIIEYMESGCVLKEKYRQRIEETFSFQDQGCCGRVLDKLLERRSSDNKG